MPTKSEIEREPETFMGVSAEAMRVLVVDDDRNLRSSLERILAQAGYQIYAAADAAHALETAQKYFYDVALVDMVLPDSDGLELLKELKALQPNAEVIVVTAFGSIESAVEAMRWGAYDYLTKPFHTAELLTTVGKALEKIALKRENQLLREQLSQQEINRILIGTSPAMVRIKKLIEQIAPSKVPVIIEGESGTGKELVAEAIRAASPRASKPLIKVSCAALPETLLEAELFGYERGAFTGAFSRKQGRFDLAHGGTLFLDEIADIPLTTQVKLLRVLQDGKYERLGGKETLYSDAQIIAATNQDLEQAVREKHFREDLYYRLNVITIRIPPLRERRDEIPVLAYHFLKLYAGKGQKKITEVSPAAMSCLLSYQWPGNVRELENVIERAVVLSEGPVIEPRALPETLNPARFTTQVDSSPSPIISITFPVGTPLTEIEDRTIQALLNYTNGDRTAAANLLGINPRTITRHLKAMSTEVEDTKEINR